MAFLPRCCVLTRERTGGCVGSIELDDPILRRLSVDFQLIVTNVDYRCDTFFRFWGRAWLRLCPIRLAPEHPFPTGINDCIAALKWVRPGFGVAHSCGSYILECSDCPERLVPWCRPLPRFHHRRPLRGGAQECCSRTRVTRRPFFQ